LEKVEQEAKKHGSLIAQTDTFDWQAKDFYLKFGYEVFGTIENCPEGHKRFYLKKLL
ncbi:TPA: GNAT family N-acetyltransferase, partial [Legionella pneumophila]|nr:GNAT family N-acetyltransferase [Legionella pneumophila]